MTFGEKLKAIRESEGLSQKQLAEDANVSQQSVAAYEIGKGRPNWGAVQRLAVALKVSCLELMDDPVPKKK